LPASKDTIYNRLLYKKQPWQVLNLTGGRRDAGQVLKKIFAYFTIKPHGIN
jgi:hypothetical protein